MTILLPDFKSRASSRSISIAARLFILLVTTMAAAIAQIPPMRTAPMPEEGANLPAQRIGTLPQNIRVMKIGIARRFGRHSSPSIMR